MHYRTFFLSIILPLAPLMIGFGLLALVDDPLTGVSPHLRNADATQFGASVFHAPPDVRFFNALLPYLAMALIQVSGCCVVALLLLRRFRTFKKAEQSAVLAIFGAQILLLGLIGALVQLNGGSGALDLGYRNVCELLNTAHVAGHILPDSCTSKGLSRFAWFALLPLIAGLVVAALASAVTSACFKPLNIADPTALKAEFDRRGALIEQHFKALAFILVTSVVSLALFYRLPLALIENSDATAVWTGYAQAMTLFWGVLFTLTLVCIFGPGTLFLNTQMTHHSDGASELDLPHGIQPHALRDRIIKILTVLAPLLVGASGSLLEMVAGAL